MAAGFCFALLDAFSRMERAAQCSSLSAARVRSRSRPRRSPSSPERARPVSILTGSGSRIAAPRLRRHAPRSAAGDGRCSYTPAPLRSLYGLVARPALSCLSDNTQSGSRAKPESVFVFMPHERERQGSGRGYGSIPTRSIISAGVISSQ